MAAETATATITHGATVTLGGRSYGGVVKTKTFTAVSKPFEDIVTCADGVYSPLLNIGATTGGATLATIKCVRIENLDATLTGRISRIEAAGKQFIEDVPPGGVIFIYSPNIEVKTDGSGFTAYTTIDRVDGAGVSGSVSFAITAYGT